MLIAVDKVVSSRTYFFIDGQFNDCDIKPKKTMSNQEDKNGVKHEIPTMYMPDSAIVTRKLYPILKLRTCVIDVVGYITSHLDYNSNIIRLVGTDIAKECNITTAQVSIGIKVLKENNVIKRVCDIDRTGCDKISKNIYVVNHSYIFKGRLKKLVEAVDKQRNEKDPRLTFNIVEK